MIEEKFCPTCGHTISKKLFCLACKKDITNEKYKYYIDKKPVCKKHYEQYRRCGKFLEKSPRSCYEPNDYKIIDDTTVEILCQDAHYNYIASFFIDKNDMKKILKKRWNVTPKYNKKGKITRYEFATTINRKKVLLGAYLLNLEYQTKHNMKYHVKRKDKNPYNYKKENLYVHYIDRKE